MTCLKIVGLSNALNANCGLFLQQMTKFILMAQDSISDLRRIGAHADHVPTLQYVYIDSNSFNIKCPRNERKCEVGLTF